jgi:hypothetical protein
VLARDRTANAGNGKVGRSKVGGGWGGGCHQISSNKAVKRGPKSYNRPDGMCCTSYHIEKKNKRENGSGKKVQQVKGVSSPSAMSDRIERVAPKKRIQK